MIYFIGDIHGDFKPIRNFYLREKEKISEVKENQILIILGDASLNFFFNYRDVNLKKKLKTYPFTYFCIRGNHEQRPSICMKENPKNWHTETFFGNTVYVENDYPYIKYALDTVAYYNINGYQTLIIPGAYSVDKYRRINAGWSWFPHEQLSQKELNAGLHLMKEHKWHTDLVLSHTCPIIYEPTDLFLSTIDQSMVEKDMERYLGNVEHILKYRVWLWGHYHAWREYPREMIIPSEEQPRQLMLYNDYVAELEDIMNNCNIVQRF